MAALLLACRHGAEVHDPPLPAPAEPLRIDGPLAYVPQRSLYEVPSHIDPTGRWLAVCEEKSGCWIWDLASSVFRGQVPKERCAGWLPIPTEPIVREPSPEPENRARERGAAAWSIAAPSGLSVAEIRGGQLTIRRGGQTAPAAAGCPTSPCAAITAVVYSPSEAQLAVVRQDQKEVHILSAEDGRSVQTLAAPHGRKIVGSLLGWSPAGLVAVVALERPRPVLASDPEDAEKGFIDHTEVATLEMWRERSEQSLFLAGISIDMSREELALDPRGRWLFQRSRHDEQFPVQAFHVAVPASGQASGGAAEQAGAPGWRSLDIPHARWDYRLELTPFTRHRWLGEGWPSWEVADAMAECSGCMAAFRVHTEPARRRLERAELRPIPEEALELQRKNPGARRWPPPLMAHAAGAVDKAGRWEGTGMGRLRRLSDGEELIMLPASCPHTGRGVYDSAQNCMASAVFLMGPDPLTARVLHGSELGPLLYHPGLVEDFFDGKPVGLAR